MLENLKYVKVDDKMNDLLDKYFVNNFRSGYIDCKHVVLPKYFEEFGDRIRMMDIRDDDIWVCSFPKSGTTWTQEMVWCIANNVDLKAAEEFLPQRFPFLEHSPMFDYRDLMEKRPEMKFPDYVLDSVTYVNNLPSPRFIKTHLPYKLLPEKLQQNSTAAKIVYVARNSRDTCVSYYYHCKLLEGYKGNFHTFCELFLQGAICFAPFWDHLLGYWEQRNNSNVLFNTYEDMNKDLKSVILKTASFLKKKISEDQSEKLLDHLSFESMKNNRAVNYEPVIEINKKYDLIKQDGTFMRCGKVGEWKEVMSPEMAEKFKKWDKEHMTHNSFKFFSKT